jgi:hypothetical protein
MVGGNVYDRSRHNLQVADFCQVLHDKKILVMYVCAIGGGGDFTCIFPFPASIL